MPNRLKKRKFFVYQRFPQFEQSCLSKAYLKFYFRFLKFRGSSTRFFINRFSIIIIIIIITITILFLDSFQSRFSKRKTLRQVSLGHKHLSLTWKFLARAFFKRPLVPFRIIWWKILFLEAPASCSSFLQCCVLWFNSSVPFSMDYWEILQLQQRVIHEMRCEPLFKNYLIYWVCHWDNQV